MTPEETPWDVPTVEIADEGGRSLQCYIENEVEFDEDVFVLLHPVDAPVEIFVWSELDDDESPNPLEDEIAIAEIFPTAKAVLAEENLTLKHTAVVLTVEGDLPELEEEDDLTVESNGSTEEVEELQWLATFFHSDREYVIYTPLDPFFLLARREQGDRLSLLDPEEIEHLEGLLPALEDRLFEGLE